MISRNTVKTHAMSIYGKLWARRVVRQWNGRGDGPARALSGARKIQLRKPSTGIRPDDRQDGRIALTPAADQARRVED